MAAKHNGKHDKKDKKDKLHTAAASNGAGAMMSTVPHPIEGPVAILGAQLIDGTGGDPIADGALLIWDNQRMLHARSEYADRSRHLTRFWCGDWRRA